MIRQIPAFALRDNPAAYATEMADLHRRYDPVAILGVGIGPTMVDIFEGLGFFRIFTAPWFTALLTLLILSIVVCTLDRTPRLWRGVRIVRVEQPAPFFDLRLAERAAFAGVEASDAALATVLRRRRFKVQASTDDEATFTYGDRNRYFKMATLLTHLGLILFLVGGAVTGAFGFETAVFVGEGQTAPVQPVGTPGNLLLKNLGFEAPTRLMAHPISARTWPSIAMAGDRAQDDPRQRPADRGRLRLPPELVRSRRDPAHPRQRRQARLVRARAHGLELLGKPQGFLTIPGSPLGLFVILDRDPSGAGRLTVVGTDGSLDASGSILPAFADQIGLGARPTRGRRLVTR